MVRCFSSKKFKSYPQLTFQPAHFSNTLCRVHIPMPARKASPPKSGLSPQKRKVVIDRRKWRFHHPNDSKKLEYFEGEVEEDAKTGTLLPGWGKFYSSNGATVVEGNFKGRALNGFGIHYVNGVKRFEGEYVMNKRHGKGRLFFENGNVKFEGRWRNNDIYGHGKQYRGCSCEHSGKCNAPKPKPYRWGFFKGKFLDGKGEQFLNGCHYKGYFKHGKLHGKGQYTFKDGTVWTGTFKNGKKHGYGVGVFKSGQVRQGIWKDDEFMHKQEAPLLKGARKNAPAWECMIGACKREDPHRVYGMRLCGHTFCTDCEAAVRKRTDKCPFCSRISKSSEFIQVKGQSFQT